MRLALVLGDITTRRVGALVNAANPELAGGGGVDGAIHAAAGPELLAECRTLGGCPPGDARITRGYRLAARYVIHAVGPVWRGGGHGEEELLASCYRQSYSLARAQALESLAFAAISTGVYGFPLERATEIAREQFLAACEAPGSLELVEFVCFNARVRAVYARVFAREVA